MWSQGGISEDWTTRIPTELLNMIQKNLDTTFHLKVDEEQWRANKKRIRGRCAENTRNTPTKVIIRMLHNLTSKLSTNAVASGLDDKARNTQRRKRLQATNDRYSLSICKSANHPRSKVDLMHIYIYSTADDMHLCMCI